jgi:hypothetical protein
MPVYVAGKDSYTLAGYAARLGKCVAGFILAAFAGYAACMVVLVLEANMTVPNLFLCWLAMLDTYLEVMLAMLYTYARCV